MAIAQIPFCVRISFLILSSILFVSTALAGTTTLSLSPVADTYVLKGAPTTNYGTQPVVQYFVGGDAKPLFEFDLSAIPSGVTILSAKFIITNTFHFNTAEDLRGRYVIHDISKDINETEANWNQAATGVLWNSAGLENYKDYNVLPFRSDPVMIVATGTYSFDLFPLVDQLREQSKTKLNFVLSTVNNAGENDQFASKENPDVSIRPRLELVVSDSTPKARAGSDIFLTAEQWNQAPFPLNGSATSFPGVLPVASINYSWTIESPAPGSSLFKGTVVGNTVSPSFDPDVPGTYVLKLRASNSNAPNEFTDDSVLVNVGVKTAHPRLHVDAALLSQWVSLKNANDPIWTRFFNWISVEGAQADPLSPWAEAHVYGSTLLYLILNQVGDLSKTTYLNKAWDVIRRVIYVDGNSRASGLKTIMANYNNDEHAAAYRGGRLLATVAIFYDWGYSGITLTQKQDLLDWMNQEITWTYFYNRSGKNYAVNDAASVLYGYASVAYVTRVDSPQGITNFFYFRNQLSEIFRILDITGIGGAMQEGNDYGNEPHAYGLALAANVVYFASGENLFKSHPWFIKRLLFSAFASYPGTGMVGTGMAPNEVAPIGGDSSHGGPYLIYSRPIGLMISRRFQGTPETDLWNWVYRQPATDFSIPYSNNVFDMLFYSPPPTLVKPTATSFFDPSLGYIFIRSNWNSPDATWIGFWGGPHLPGHAHYQQGSFVIFKRRDLAIKSGTSTDVNHAFSFGKRTISANNLLIGDPNEVFGSILSFACNRSGQGTYGTSSMLQAVDNRGPVCVPNDGGQRITGNCPDAETYHFYRDTFEAAKVVSFLDDEVSVRWVADITNAYQNPRFTNLGNSPKVNRVYRKFVYLKSLDLLFVGDSVESTNANFEKVWLIHALEKIEVGGATQSVSAGEEVHTNVNQFKIVVEDSDFSDKNQTHYDFRTGYSSLLVTTLFPKYFNYRKVGGRSPSNTPHADLYNLDTNNYQAQHYHTHIKDFWIKDYSEGVIPNHQSLNWPPEITETYPPGDLVGGYGRWRLQVEPVVRQKEDQFLNVMMPSTDPNAKMPSLSRFETASTFGATVASQGDKYRVEFTKDSLDLPAVSAAVPVGGKWGLFGCSASVSNELLLVLLLTLGVLGLLRTIYRSRSIKF